MNQEPNSPTGSHPVIRFEQVPIVEGKLNQLEKLRPAILKDVVARSEQDLSHAPKDLILGEALYSERLRMRRNRPNIFTKSRFKGDARLWSGIQAGMVRPSAQVDRNALLSRVLEHYSQEVGGHFDQKVYHFATRAVPWLFSWLLNAASVQRFLPWGMTQSLEDRLRILGEVPHLQRLAQRGTILLVPTHQSNIDSVLLGYVIYLMSLPPFAYGAGLNLFSNPIFNYFMSNLGAYTVDRQKSNEIYKHVLKNYSTRILREGIHSIFFPGGGRSRSGAIESKIKLGLLGTGLDAQLWNLREGKEKPSVFVVPMVMSYHFVLEASSLIEDYLVESGKARFIITDDESWQPAEILRFFWRLFSTKSGITVRIGKPLDIFGNFVDEEGQSIGPNGTTIDPRRWLTTRGELRPNPQRDHEYTRELGAKLVDRFHRGNTVLTSHLVAFTFFETLRSKYPDLDLFRFLRLSRSQRTITHSEFLDAARVQHGQLLEAARRGELFLSEELATLGLETWVEDGLKQLGMLHGAAVVRSSDGAVWTEDMNLLYYYRNRLAGYGLSLLAQLGGAKGNPDSMTQKDFWPNAKVAVIGGGSWGTVLANLAARNCREVRLWVRDPEVARSINATRINQEYLPELSLHERVHAMTELDRVFDADGVAAVIWALPSSVCREQAKRLAPLFHGDEVVLHATKGLEEGSLKRVSQILREELPCPRIGVISGPNLADEVARGEPAATVVASVYNEVIEAGVALLSSEKFRIYWASDVIGVEWAGTLKNVLAIAAGALDAMKLGWNARSMLITRGLAEMVRFGVAMGAKESTFLGLAGIGDLLATCSSPLSRNYRVGVRLAHGERIDAILSSLGETAEGVRTTRTVYRFAQLHKISMPITEAVHMLIEEGVGVQQVLHTLMTRPQVSE